jgi:integrase
MEAKKIEPTIGNVTREIAGDYLSQARGGPKTRVNMVLMLSSYFSWLVKPRAKMISNPFEGLSCSIEDTKQARIRKRPFTDEEISRLLLDAPADLSDAIRILALSGMWASEFCSLTVADCRGDVFRVHGGPDDEERRGKSLAAKREIPIHIDISRMVNDLRRGRAGTEFLFH